MNNKEYNKWYLVISFFAIIFTFFGGSLAYWQWTTNTSERTNIALTVKEDFRCDADGGGDISNDEKYLVPTDCTNSEYAIQRTVTVKPTLFTNQLGVDLDLWLTINNIGTGLRNSNNFKYVLTTNSNSCTEGIVSSGTFKSKSNGSKVTLLDSKIYLESTTDTYYLYVWLDSAETSTSTMDQEFSLSLGGECISTTEGIINGVGTGGYAEPILNGADPVLDDGMVPILLSDTGVATVADIDSKWYNYENKEWANMVLVKENATSGVTGSYSREYYLNNPGTTVLESDILAYYVWIPRYKYKVKNGVKCSKLSEYYLTSPVIDNFGMFNYPECYAPYTMTETDKSVISEALYMVYLEETGDEEFSLEHSVSDLNDGLITGKVNLMGIEEVSLIALVYLLNSQMELNLTLNGTFNEENLTSNLGSIDISFQSLFAPISTGDAIDTYKTHPAFTFGNEGLNGIWVGKFETSTDTSSACYTSTSSSNCNNTNQEPRILPNVMSLRYQNVSNQFQTSLKFAGGTMNASTGVVTFAGSNTYGLTNQTDSHMMKNSEWGAVAYLSHSLYGINEEIYVNDSSEYYTGRSAGVVGNDFILSIIFGSYTWVGQKLDDMGNIGIITDSTLGTKASTTGNVTGIYDMSGGAAEYVMGNYNNTVRYSEFTTFPESKYYDLYLESQFDGDYETNMQLCTLDTCGGHALYETSNWYLDNNDFVYSMSPWFVRGGGSSSGLDMGAFASDGSSGSNSEYLSWRSVLIVGE